MALWMAPHWSTPRSDTGPAAAAAAAGLVRTGLGEAPFSRRAALIGGATLALSPFLLAACGGGSSDSAGATAAATGTAKRGGQLRIARPPASDAETLDPASSLSAYEYLGALYNRLVKQAPDGTVAADLATAWEGSADSLTWTFTLRDDVTFHDGQAFTSADAAYTLAHILDPATASPQAGVLSGFLTPAGIGTPDPKTLVCTLTAPNAEFVSLLMNYNCYVIPKDSAGTIGTSGIGTGPFSLTSFTPAGPGELAAYADHFAGRPVLDSISFTSIAETQARVNALLAGQVDLVSQTNLDKATALSVTGSGSATTAVVKNAYMYVLPMLATSSPFSDPTVRQAFKLAYQPTDLLSLSVNDAGTVAHDNPVVPTDPYYLDYTVDPDPDKAKSLLQKAGFSGSQALFTTDYDPVLSPMSLAYQDSAKAAGLAIDVQNAPADSYYTDIWLKKPFCSSYWYTGRPVDQLLNQLFRTGSSYNEAAWSNPQYDSALDAARAEPDTDKRKQHYQDAQKLLIDDSGTIIPFFADRTIGLSTTVVNYSEFGFEFDYVNIGLKA